MNASTPVSSTSVRCSNSSIEVSQEEYIQALNEAITYYASLGCAEIRRPLMDINSAVVDKELKANALVKHFYVHGRSLVIELFSTKSSSTDLKSRIVTDKTEGKK